MDKDIETYLDRILSAGYARVIQPYEDQIAALEQEKAVLAEKALSKVVPSGTFDEKLEPALTLLASPWKIWETGNIAMRRLVLKPAFADRFIIVAIRAPEPPK